MTIDTSLDTLMLPALPTYKNEFGTKRLNGGLTTAECTDGVMIWGRRQRPFPVIETSETTKVEAHCTFEVTTAGIELTIADATFAGCEAKVINASDGTITVKGGVSGLNGSADAVTIPPRAMLFLTFFEGWITSNSTYSGSNEVSDFEKRIFLAAHPPTTLYWTSDPRNPGDVYGGTWKQIKDRFILAAGDTYTNGATGGNATTTLTTANLPSHAHGLNNHTHDFTPAGTVSAHAHGLNNHTHSFTPKGTVASHSHPMPHTHTKGDMNITGTLYVVKSTKVKPSGAFEQTDSYPEFGQAGGGYHNTTVRMNAKDSWTGTTSEPSNANTESTTPTFTGTAGTTGAASGNTASATPTFTGTAGTTGTASGNTTATGSGTAFSNMPPYAVKYCWERVV